MNKTLLASALLLTTVSAHAVDAPQWDQASLSYVSADLGEGVDLSGLAIAGTKLINENVFLFGRFELTNDNVSVDGDKYRAELSRLSAGAGYRLSVTESTDLFGKASFEHYSTETSVKYNGAKIDVENSYTGFGVEVGVRSFVVENLELGATIGFINMRSDDDEEDENDSDTALNLMADYHFNDKFSLGVAHSKFDDADFTELKGTLSF